MSRVVPVSQWSRFEVLRGAAPEDIEQLHAACEELVFQPGEIVLAAGHHERALWFLVLGNARITIDIPGQGRQRISEISGGSVVGEVSFLHAASHSATVTAESACTFLRLGRQRFDLLAGACPALASRLVLNIAELLAARLQAVDQWMIEWLTTAQESRLRDRAEQLREAFAMRSPATSVFLGLNWNS